MCFARVVGSAEVAVKVMHARPEEPDRRALYRREAAVIGTLTHPALPRIYAVGELDGRPALVMELVEGETLQERLARGAALPEQEVVRLGIRVAGALSAAHEAGVVHRDVKPANLVIDASGEAKLIDFGLAAQSGTLQARDATIGTVRYSPPEQTGLLQRPVDGRSDLYSLGATLFEAATGHAPFAAADVGELARLHAVAEPPDPLVLAPELSPALAAILLRLLAKDPDDRYQSAHGLLHDLELTHHRPPHHTRSARAIPRAACPRPPRSSGGSRSCGRWRPRGRRPPAAVAAWWSRRGPRGSDVGDYSPSSPSASTLACWIW